MKMELAMLAVVLSFVWVALWMGLWKSGKLKQRWARVLLVLAWIVAGGVVQGNGGTAGIPGLVQFILFPLIPFQLVSDFYGAGLDQGMDPTAADSFSLKWGFGVGIPMILSSVSAHIFLWVSQSTAPKAVPRQPGQVSKFPPR